MRKIKSGINRGHCIIGKGVNFPEGTMIFNVYVPNNNIKVSVAKINNRKEKTNPLIVGDLNTHLLVID